MKRVSKCEKSISTGKFSTFTELINLTYGNLKKLLSFRSSHPEVFLEKVVPKVCRKFTGKHPYRSMIFRRRCSENMPQIYKRTPMPKCDFNKVALKLHFGMCLFLKICCIFSEHLLLRTPQVAAYEERLRYRFFPVSFPKFLQIFFKRTSG